MERAAAAGARQLRVLVAPLALATALLGAVACRPAGAENAPTSHLVEMRGFAFVPATLSLSPGDTVVWVNRDVVPHTASAPPGGWDSGSIEPGGSWSRVFTEADSSDYVCAFHPTMKGLLAVR